MSRRPSVHRILRIDFNEKPPAASIIPSSPRLARAKRHLKRLAAQAPAKVKYRLDGLMPNPSYTAFVPVHTPKAPRKASVPKQNKKGK